MFTAVTKERGFISNLESLNRAIPCLPLLDTEEMLSHMPKGGWEIPKEPYTFLEKIEDGEWDFMRDEKRKRFAERSQRILGAWVYYLDRVQRGRLIVERFSNEGVISGDVGSTESYSFFYRVMRPRLSEEVTIERAIDSCRKAFLFLLTDSQAGQLGHPRPEKLEDDDIRNTKFLIRRSVSVVFPGFPIEID